MSALSSILASTSLPTPNVMPSDAKAITFLLEDSIDNLFDTIKLKPKNELISPFANALTVLKSELVTSVVPNRSVICLGDTTINLAIDGSTLAKSNFSFAVLNFAIVKPSVPLSVIFCAEGNTVEVDPVSPVNAVPVAALI